MTDEIKETLKTETKPKTVSITVIAEHPDGYVVRSDAGKYKILPKLKVQNTYYIQDIPLQDFDKGITPYNWKSEIARYSVTVEEILELLYLAGFTDSTQKLGYQDFVNALKVRGKAPVIRS